MKNINQFCYETEKGFVKGFFNIYQAINGAIYMSFGNLFIKLNEYQIKDLSLDLYTLKDFNIEKYAKHYQSSEIHSDKLQINLLKDKLSRRNKMIAYLRNEHTKRGGEIEELKNQIAYYKGHAGAALIGNELAKEEALKDIINR